MKQPPRLPMDIGNWTPEHWREHAKWMREEARRMEEYDRKHPKGWLERIFTRGK